jgi:hypothetical protein
MLGVSPPSSPSDPSNPFKPSSARSTYTFSRKRKCLATAAVLIIIPALAYSFFGAAEAPNLLRTRTRTNMVSIFPYRPVTVQQAERMADRLLQSNPEAIRPKFVGQTGRSKVEHIFWLHVSFELFH